MHIPTNIYIYIYNIPIYKNVVFSMIYKCICNKILSMSISIYLLYIMLIYSIYVFTYIIYIIDI